MSPTACMNLHLLSMCCFLSFSSSFFPMWGFSGCSFFFFMNFLCGCCGGDALSHRASSTASCGEFQHCTGRREGVDRRTHHSTSLFLDTICWFVSKELFFSSPCTTLQYLCLSAVIVSLYVWQTSVLRQVLLSERGVIFSFQRWINRLLFEFFARPYLSAKAELTFFPLVRLNYPLKPDPIDSTFCLQKCL